VVTVGMADAQRDRLGVSSATDARKRRVSPVIFSVLPCYAEIGPCYFFRGILPESLTESALDGDIAGISDQFLRSSLYLPCKAQGGEVALGDLA
jgi:hypothetical protein